MRSSLALSQAVPPTDIDRHRRGRFQQLWRGLTKNKLVMIGLLLGLLFAVMAAVPAIFTPYGPYGMDMAASMSGPSADHWQGTDSFGRDIWSRVVYGARTTLGIAVASVGLAVVIGATLGIVAGYAAGRTDQVLGRVMDVFFGFPPLLLAIVVAGVLGPSVRNAILAIAVVNVPVFFRVARGPSLAEREKEYIQAAVAIGVPSLRVLLRHLLPNIVAPVIVQVAVTLSYAILIEASLSYLGLGVQPPNPSWGSILNEGRPYLEFAPWISVFPGLTIMLAVLGFNLLGDGLRDLWDPRNAT